MSTIPIHPQSAQDRIDREEESKRRLQQLKDQRATMMQKAQQVSEKRRQEVCGGSEHAMLDSLDAAR